MRHADKALRSKPRLVLRAAFGLSAVALLVIYLAQYWRLKPTDTDDGLILDYIHQMSLGARPHWDMVDAYGLFNWVFPVLFYKLAGQRVWGVHLWLLVLKVSSVLLCYRTVASSANRLYGIIAALWLTVLLGQGWQPLQSPYAFLSVVPLVLGTWYLLVSPPFRSGSANAAAASVLTTLAIWTKLNTGLYLFAAGFLALLCWGRSAEPAADGSVGPGARWLKRSQIVVAVLYALLLGRYVAGYVEGLYVAYLLVPLALIVAWVIYGAVALPVSEARARERLLCAGMYAGVTLALSLVILFGYYGAHGIADYARELTGILTTIRYHYPFPPTGKPWFFVGYNENYWPQIPWLVSLAFAVWVVIGRYRGKLAFGTDWPTKVAQASTIFLLLTVHTFVLYPRSDDMHVYQALLLAVPALFILLFQLDVFLRGWLPRGALLIRPVLAVAGVAYASTLAIWPTLDVLRLRAGDYANPRLEYLDYRPVFNPKIRSFAPEVGDREWDELVDQAGRYIDSITEENEPILVLCDVRFLHFASRTKSVGGRYAFYFYLIAVQLLDRAGFDQIVPPFVVADIMAHPPRVIVTRGDKESFVPQFPELRAFRDQYYVETKLFRYIHIFERKPGAEAATK